MRILSQAELLATLPVELREKSKTGQAYVEIRRKILLGDYQPEQVISPREIEKEYRVSNTGAQNILSRLAIEGLIKVYPIKKAQCYVSCHEVQSNKRQKRKDREKK